MAQSRAEYTVQFGRCVTYWRQARGETLPALAARVGISKGHLWEIETGQTLPSVWLALRLAWALEASLDLLATMMVPTG